MLYFLILTLVASVLSSKVRDCETCVASGKGWCPNRRMCGGFANKSCIGDGDARDFAYPASYQLKDIRHAQMQPGEDKMLLAYDDETPQAVIDAYLEAALILEEKIHLGHFNVKDIEAYSNVISAQTFPAIKIHSLPADLLKAGKHIKLPSYYSGDFTNVQDIVAFAADYFTIQIPALDKLVKEFMMIKFKGQAGNIDDVVDKAIAIVDTLDTNKAYNGEIYVDVMEATLEHGVEYLGTIVNKLQRASKGDGELADNVSLAIVKVFTQYLFDDAPSQKDKEL